MNLLVTNKKVEFKVTKREAISNTKKLASMLAKIHIPILKRNELEMDVDNQIITPMEVLENIVKSFEFILKCKYKKECLEVLNNEIENRWKGESRRLNYE